VLLCFRSTRRLEPLTSKYLVLSSRNDHKATTFENISFHHPRMINIYNIYLHKHTHKHTHTDDIPVRVYFGVDAKPKKAGGKTRADPSKRVGKDEIPTLESELLAAEEILNDISNEIEFARKQEIVLKEIADSTASRIEWFSIFSVVILLFTSLWQIIYLRHFFTSKKLI
jgi:emp24/gp25L/p24 family/GOLD